MSLKQNKLPYFSDHQLFRRVDKYLGDRIPDNFNKEEMVEDLRKIYKEYGRRNKSAFRTAVIKAYEILRQTMAQSMPDETQADSEEIEGEIDEEEDFTVLDSPPTPQNYMQTIQNMSNNSIPRIRGRRENVSQELINISSDEDEPKKSSKPKTPKKAPPYFMDPARFPDLHIRAAASYKSPMFPSVHEYKESRKRKSPPSSTPMAFQPASKKRRESLPDIVPSVTFKDFGGYSKVIETIGNLILHFYQYECFTILGVSPPRGFLLHGPPGCGKTLLAQAVAGELGLPLVSVAGPELVGGMSGESEQRIRDLFAKAKEQVPCALFIDEIDAICQSRETARKDMERRIVSQLLASLDDLNECEEGADLIVIGATNRLEVLDPALRRAGRFDKEVCIGIPDRKAREGVLSVMCSKVKLSPEVSLAKLAELTPGYVAADLKALISEAAVLAVKRAIADYAEKTKAQQAPQTNGDIDIDDSKKPTEDKETASSSEVNDEKKNDEGAATEDKAPNETTADDGAEDDFCEIIGDVPKPKTMLIPCPLSQFQFSPTLTEKEVENLYIELQDVMGAFKTVQPSAKREGFATVPDVTWDDVGSLRDVRDELKMSIMMPVKYPEEFAKMGIDAPSGIMLCGPPGCGKTLLAKAVANEANINFISVKGPELLNMYVGESERAVRQVFQRAKNSQPCVIFFDEIDALCPKRSDSTEGTVSSRVVNQVLTEMDGVEGREGVFLMAATNRPDMVDPAVMRPGRFDKILYVGLPSPSERVEILRAVTKNGTKPVFSPDVSLEEIGNSENCEGYSGADLAALVKEASLIALSEYICIMEGPPEDMTPCESPQLVVQPKHFTHALAKVKPSVSAKDQKRYDSLRTLYGPKSIDPDTEMDIET